MHRDSLPYEISVINTDLTKKTDVGLTIEKLTEGQWAAFDYNTNQVFDLAQTDKVPKQFYICYVEDGKPRFIGDPYIDRDGFRLGHKVDSSDGVPQIVDIKGFESTCSGEYAIRLTFDNELIARRQGYNQFSHTVSVRSRCCKDCADNAPQDPNFLAFDLFKSFLDNPQIPVTVDLLDDDGVGAALSTEANTEKKIKAIEAKIESATYHNAANPSSPKKRVKLRISVLPVPKHPMQSLLNPHYMHPRMTTMHVGLLGGFVCNAVTIEQVQGAKMPQGDGYDIRQLEYVAGGWTGNPGYIRLGNELPYENMTYRADVDAKYTQYCFTQDKVSQTTWVESVNRNEIVIAVKTPGSNGGGIGEALLKLVK